MPETIISQFQRAYNSPIETRRQVNTTTERDNMPSSVRWRGMLVHVISDNVTYELVGGIDNGSWQPLIGLQDAPSDGETYGRRDGAWEIIGTSQGTAGLLVSSTTLVELNGVVTDEELRTYTIPANTLTQNGDMVKIMTYGSTNLNVTPAGSLDLDLWVNSINIAPLVQYTTGIRSYWLEIYLVRTGATELSLKAIRQINSTAGPIFTGAFPVTVGGFSFDASTDTIVQLMTTMDHANNSVDSFDFNVELKTMI